ncbi:MAG: hypothetical protein ACI9Y1_000430 [Lentisphaeria bacterium]|jgi:hypothetical protein
MASDERRNFRRYAVNWRARVLLPDRQLYEVTINNASKGGVAIDFDRVLALGTILKIEFYIKYRGKMKRIRAKVKVSASTVLSDNRGAKLGLQFVEVSTDNLHSLANVLHILGDENEDV